MIYYDVNTRFSATYGRFPFQYYILIFHKFNLCKLITFLPAVVVTRHYIVIPGVIACSAKLRQMHLHAASLLSFHTFRGFPKYNVRGNFLIRESESTNYTCDNLQNTQITFTFISDLI